MRVLIADDDPTVRVFLTRVLQPITTADTASGGAEALELFKEALTQNRPYGLVLLDLMMPSLDGCAVLDAIRACEEPMVERGTLQPTKVIMITGSEEEEAHFESLMCGCDGFLRKPIDRSALLRELDTLTAGMEGRA